MHTSPTDPTARGRHQSDQPHLADTDFVIAEIPVVGDEYDFDDSASWPANDEFRPTDDHSSVVWFQEPMARFPYVSRGVATVAAVVIVVVLVVAVLATTSADVRLDTTAGDEATRATSLDLAISEARRPSAQLQSESTPTGADEQSAATPLAELPGNGADTSSPQVKLPATSKDFAEGIVSQTTLGGVTSSSTVSTVAVATSTTVALTTSTTGAAPAPASTGVWDYYGNPWVPSDLANLTLQNERYSYRFLAKHSGTMLGFQNYMQANTSRTGYGGGDGGTIRYQLVPDNGSGHPDESQVLAEVIWHPGLINGSALPPGTNDYTASHRISFADKYWPTKPTLIAGNRYHLVIENVDTDKNSNYISINNPYATNNRTRSPLGPQIDDWGLEQNTGNGWNDYTQPYSGTRYEINLMILMENGNHYGNSYMDTRNEYPVNGSNQLRQIFTPTTNHTIDQLAVFTSGTGTLRTTLKENGNTIGTWTNNTTGENHNIINTGTHTLKAGTTYQLEFSADNGSLNMITYREGSLGTGYLYPKGGSWDDGHSQNNTGNGWNNTFYDYSDLAGVAFHTN